MKMRSRHGAFGVLGTVVGVVGVLLAGCDSGPSALPARDHSKAAMEQAAQAAASRPDERGAEARAPAPLVDGKPMWSANRKYSAEQNAQYHFKRNGADFGAKSVDQFVRTAHDFVTDPPKGTLTLKRANGDTLMYDPKGNVFAVATKDGAPRTLFKPDDGLAYWNKQKDREAKVAGGRSVRGGEA